MSRIVLPFILLSWMLLGASAGEKDKPKPPPAGFTSLFNGKDLTGWKDADKRTEWKVEDGVIHYIGKGGKNLVSAKNYKNFELWVDWKIAKGGDSGIHLRGKPQVQIWDNKEGSGGLYDNPPKSDGQKPLLDPKNKIADKKPGEWNTFYIKMVGAKVTVVLNGVIVVDNAKFLDGKVPDEGPIELQVHDNPVWFRNIYVREIVPDKK
jgi:hypothetical protein